MSKKIAICRYSDYEESNSYVLVRRKLAGVNMQLAANLINNKSEDDALNIFSGKNTGLNYGKINSNQSGDNARNSNSIRTGLTYGSYQEDYAHKSSVKMSSGQLIKAGYTNDFSNETGKTVAEEALADQVAMNVETRVSQMTIMSQTASEEDLSRMDDEGFDPLDASSNTVCSVLDKIEINMAKQGASINGLGEDVSDATINAASSGKDEARRLKSQIESALKSSDLPVNDEIVQASLDALNKAVEIVDRGLSDTAKNYLVSNSIEPTIANIYYATMAQANDSGEYGLGKYEISDQDFNQLKPQLEKLISTAGLEVDDESLGQCKWLLNHGIDLNAKNLAYLDKLSELSDGVGFSTMDVSGENKKGLNVGNKDKINKENNGEENIDSSEESIRNKVMSSITAAIQAGQRPKDAYMLDGYSMQDRAKEAVQIVHSASQANVDYLVENGMALTLSNLKIAINQKATGVGEYDVDFTYDLISPGDQNTDVSLNKSGEEKSTENSYVEVGKILMSGETQLVGKTSLSAYSQIEIEIISARRKLEEARLVMTEQANLSLLKKGIGIDTKPLADLVEELKGIENDYYRNLLADNDVEASKENVEIFKNTVNVLEETKYFPAKVIRLDMSLKDLHDAGKSAIGQMATDRYETMMTQPRADLGDSIRKAFANVDDILADLGLETTEANERAVRILGYNSLEINEENISMMKAADEQVQSVFSNLTPQVTMELIRQNINPLDMKLDELNQQIDEIKDKKGLGKIEKYSKFLNQLDKAGQISEEERQTYIGIYRLIAQVEKTDGKAIGALIHKGDDITMRNLLTAVRTAKKGGMDYSVDDDFAGVEAKSTSPRIDEQILGNYYHNCIKEASDKLTVKSIEGLSEEDVLEMNPEELRDQVVGERNRAIENMLRDSDKNLDIKNMTGDSEKNTNLENRMEKSQMKEESNMNSDSANSEDTYIKDVKADIDLAANLDRQIYDFLEQNDITNSVNNALAADRMLRNPGKMVKDFWTVSDKIEAVRDMKEQILEEFAVAVETPEGMADAVETLADMAENCMKNMIIEDPDTRNLDIKALKLLGKEFSISRNMSRQENYVIPMETTDGNVVGVNLKIIRGEKEKGLVDIMFSSENLGNVVASINVKDASVSGMIATDKKEAKEELDNMMESLSDSIKDKTGIDEVKIQAAYINDLDMYKYGTDRKESTHNEEASQIQTAKLYGVAKSLLQHMGK